MARFIGRLKGGRGEVSRLGTPASGMTASAQGWDVGAKVEVIDRDGRDVVFVYATGGSNGRCSSQLVATIRCDDKGELVVERTEAPKTKSKG